MNPGHDTADAAGRLRRAGLRVTGSRLAILAELARDRTHPNVWDLHRRLGAKHPSLSVSTVYLALEAFAKAGLVRRIPARDGRLRVDGTPANHDHAVCRDCGGVYDVPAVDLGRRPLPAGLPRGAKVLGARVEYDVLCGRCQRTSRVRRERDACLS